MVEDRRLRSAVRLVVCLLLYLSMQVDLAITSRDEYRIKLERKLDAMYLLATVLQGLSGAPDLFEQSHSTHLIPFLR